eukprot:CAMPEP_0179001172 /NCGR_PEP_ID=MMETSP0795-20121207/11173_1 /TAXON_ID=88552 /ORGANISM="Amoebophrya sp., Strain Ameob2" /LENGTH=47 /DNA_ID= /DNA_START= /DNA_END= /DNA_ORIENTATION=
MAIFLNAKKWRWLANIAPSLAAITTRDEDHSRLLRQENSDSFAVLEP